MTMRSKTLSFLSVSALVALTSAGLLASIGASEAQAQIKSPGAHIRYTAELEPHLVLQHSDDDGIGVGFRASFPIIDNGPIRTINNSFALGVGLDWSHHDDDGWCDNNNFGDDDCDGNDFWVPLVVQWNFFFSDLISAFPEIGAAIEYEDDNWDRSCVNVGGNRVCGGDDDDGDIDVELVLWLGVRFHLAKEFALTVRLGTPSVLIGASFFL